VWTRWDRVNLAKYRKKPAKCRTITKKWGPVPRTKLRLDIERDEPSHGLDVIEGIEVEPLVLERSPPGLDQGVREAYIPQRQHTAQQAGDD